MALRLLRVRRAKRTSKYCMNYYEKQNISKDLLRVVAKIGFGTATRRYGNSLRSYSGRACVIMQTSTFDPEPEWMKFGYSQNHHLLLQSLPIICVWCWTHIKRDSIIQIDYSSCSRMYNEKEENIELDTQIVEDPCQDSVHDQLLSFFDRPLHFCLET